MRPANPAADRIVDFILVRTLLTSFLDDDGFAPQFAKIRPVFFKEYLTLFGRGNIAKTPTVPVHAKGAVFA